MDSPTQAYPLSWPAGVLRTPPHERVHGSFDSTPDKVRREMLQELDRLILGKRSRTHTVRGSVILSTNVALRLDGEPIAGRNEPTDPGVALYFKKDAHPMVIASDKYDKVWKNMRAIQRTLEALRAIERYGSSQLQERAFTGFRALPMKGTVTIGNWWNVLGVEEAASFEHVQFAYRALSKKYHPDNPNTADPERFLQVQQAFEVAKRQFNKT